MALSGIHIACTHGNGAYPGADAGNTYCPIIGPRVTWSETSAATSGTTTAQIPTVHPTYRTPVVEVRSTFDAWVAFDTASPDPVNGARRLVRANQTYDMTDRSAAKVGWAPATLSGVHLVFGYAGAQYAGDGPGSKAILPLPGPIASSQTMASAGTSSIAAPANDSTFGPPILSVESSVAIWLAWGTSPDASNGPRLYVNAAEPLDVYVRPGDVVAWIAA